MENFYTPLRASFDGFLSRNDNEAGRAVVAASEEEIALYERNAAYVSYGFYVARRLDD